MLLQCEHFVSQMISSCLLRQIPPTGSLDEVKAIALVRPAAGHAVFADFLETSSLGRGFMIDVTRTRSVVDAELENVVNVGQVASTGSVDSACAGGRSELARVFALAEG
jgi:hypothetical protein